jgi:alpha-mannosidase
VELFIEAASNPVLVVQLPTYEGDTLTASHRPLYRLGRMELAVFEADVWELVQDLEVLYGMMTQLGEADARRHEVLRAIERSLDAVDLADVAATAARARAQLTGVLASPATASAHRVSAVGHAHLDSAWLWPLRETVRKAARTCSSVVQLMDDHPELVFAMSQAQQLAWLKEHRPEVFDRVQEKVAAGQFVPVGGMWVESDTNLVGGEAMARQFLYGKAFFREEFGIEIEEVWLPDSFGYSAAMPIAARREAVAPERAANLLQIHPDVPTMWDAWDIDAFYRHSVTDLVHVDALTLASSGPDQARVQVLRSFGSSSVVQHLSLRRDAKVLDVDTEVDWHEQEKLLKAAFPLDVKAERSAAETQFGHVYRATHTKTSWEAAKFEICAHRWIHVGEPGWGAAVVNDSTYGHDVTREMRADGGQTTTVRLSLLRAPRYPDPETDQGRHRLRYALAPGAGIIDAVREGYWLNVPQRTVTGGGAVAPLVAVDNDAVVVEAVKLAEDRGGDVVVRLYESAGGRATAALTTGFPLAAAVATDLLERPLDQAPDAPGVTVRTRDGRVELALRPFQIVTLRLSVTEPRRLVP